MLRIIHSSGSKVRHVPLNSVKKQALVSHFVASKCRYHASSNAKNSNQPMRGMIKNIFEESAFLRSVAPKGFGKYFPRGEGGGANSKKAGPINTGSKSNKGSSNKESSTPKENSSKNTNKGGEGSGNGSGRSSGGGSGAGKKPESDKLKLASAMGIGLAAFLAILTLDDMKKGHEISWQDFQRQLLEAGLVDRIIVTNKNLAKIVLRMPVSDKDNSLLPQAPKHGDQSGGTYASPFPNDSPPPFHENSAFATEAAESSSKLTPYARYPSLGAPANQNTPYYFNISTVDTFERKLEEAQVALGIAPRDFIPVIYVNETSWAAELIRLLPTVLLIGATFWMMRGLTGGMGGGAGGPGGIFKIGKSNAKKIQKEKVTTKFANVAGCDEAKREIMEFVQFLKEPKRFTDLGAKIPKGALLSGPPGTGKTLLARATAGEANVPFYSISGSDFVEMFVGVGPSRVRDLFKEARENAPCIIFIDEIDAVGRARGSGRTGGNDERENTLNQLLVEMDGFDSSTNVIILAGTNRIDVLDNALTRPGRFDRQITVEKPDIKGRKEIFEVYLKEITLEGDVSSYSKRLAALTPGFVGADIANICNEAAIQAARAGKSAIDMVCFELATDRVIGGLESRKIMSPEERRTVAYHEAGHAVAGWNLEYADPLLKVTIVPRGSGALGFAQYLPKELFLRTREQILDLVCMALAGRAAEQVNFGVVTTGASDDLRRVTQIVYQMVQVYGMNDKVGQVAFPQQEQFQERMYSDQTAEVMDQEVRAIVDEAYKRTLQLMQDKKHQVEMVAELLLVKETITNADVTELIGKRPFESSKEYNEYISIGWNDAVLSSEEKEAGMRQIYF